ncbi:hypothetical protein BKA70DRAFT_1155235 [Coprinopsis sp. MPI-PUGE-AT-0042]|nr:hypothetical protein BKA70DRAFT_1155235 [Coprinopsis sp. MPI-PUGE-AT-0042]
MSGTNPEHPKQLDFYGHIVSQSIYANTNLTFVAVGISWFMVIDSLVAFLDTPKKYRKGRAKFLWISFAISAIFSADTIRGSWGAYERLYSSLPDGKHYLRQYSLVTGITSYSRLSSILIDLYIAMGDVLMLYRAFAMWRHCKWVLLPPTMTILAHIVLAILTPIQLPSFSIEKSTLAVMLLNVSTNIMITALIITRLTRVRKKVTTAVPGSKKQRMDLDVMAILIESAVPLAVFGVLCAVIQIISIYATDTLYERARWEGSASALALLYYSFCALSPQMVVFWITSGRSWNHQQQTVDGDEVFSRPIQFAHTELDSIDSPSLNAERRGQEATKKSSNV